MLKLHKIVALMTLTAVMPILSLTARAETLRFAWPDGASAKVQSRSEGRRVQGGREIIWDMSCDFTMQVRRAGDRLVVSRHGFSGWKGTFPPNFGGGAERYINMIPTFNVSADGVFLGIEGQEATRKLMMQSVEQSGGLEPIMRGAFEMLTSDAALEAMAKDHWSSLIRLWLEVELDPDAAYEIESVASVPQLGGGQLDIKGTVGFIKETDCAGGRRCVQLQGETAADKAQVNQLIQAMLREAGADRPAVTAWDQRFKLDIVLDKATMLPQQLTIRRVHAMDIRVQGRSESGSEDITYSYTFAWALPDGQRKS